MLGRLLLGGGVRLPHQQVSHRAGGNEQDELGRFVLLGDLLKLFEQLGIANRLVSQHEIAGHDAPPALPLQELLRPPVALTI